MMLAALCLLALQSPWPGFRGPERSGNVPHVRLPAAFDPDLDRLWRRELPPGHSSPVLAGDGVFVTFCRRGQVFTACFDAADGRRRWERAEPRPAGERAPRDEASWANHAASSPVTDGRGLFVWFPDFGLVAYELSGEERWRLPLVRWQGPYPGASSPALAQGRLVHVFDHDRRSFLIAVDPADGSILWKTDRPFATHGYSSPTILGDVVIVSGSRRVDAYDLHSGRNLWWAEGMAWQPRSTPVGGDGVVFVQSAVNTQSQFGSRISSKSWSQALEAWDRNGDGRIVHGELTVEDMPGEFWKIHDLDENREFDSEEWERLRGRMKSGSGLWALRLGGEGDVGESHVLWTRMRRVPLNPTPLRVGDVLVMLRDGWNAIGIDARDGSELWTTSTGGLRSKVYSSPIAIGGEVLIIDENGMLAILDPSDGRVLATHELEEEVWATPAVGTETFFVRTSEALHAYRLAAPPADLEASAFVGVDVLTMDERGKLRDQTVVVREGRVVRLGPREDTPLSERIEVLAQGPGLTVVPGLIDMWTRVEDEHEPLRHLLAGVTTLRVVDGRPALLELREAIGRGEVPGPELVIGAPVFRADLDPSKAAAAVDAAIAAGYDFVSASRDLRPQGWHEAAAHAQELGFPFAGVRHHKIGLEEVLASQPWTLDHFETLASEPDLAVALARAEVGVTPMVSSFSVWIEAAISRREWIETRKAVRDISPIVHLLWSPEAGALHRGLTRRELQGKRGSLRAQRNKLRGLDAAGVQLLAGSDSIASFIHPGQGLHRELRTFVGSGLAPADALRAATVAPGRVLERVLGEARGTVTAGGVANLILVAGDPLANLRRLEEPRGVMVGGRWYRRGELEAALELAREIYRREAAFVQAVVALRPAGTESLAEALESEAMQNLELRESTARRLVELLRLPRIRRVRDAATVEAFAERRWPNGSETVGD